MDVEELLRLLVSGAQWPHEVELVEDVRAALKRLPVRDRVLLAAVAMGYTKKQAGVVLHIVHPRKAYQAAKRRLVKELAA